jgi:hypothetical protein
MKSFKLITHKSDDPKGKNLKIVFEGELALPNASEIMKELKLIPMGFETLEMIARDVTSIDLSFIQIIEAFGRSMKERKKDVKVLMDLPYDLKELLATAGIDYPSK